MVVAAIRAVAGDDAKELYLPAFQTLAFLLNACLRCRDMELVTQINAQRHERLVGKRHAAAVKLLLARAGLIHFVHDYRVGDRCRAFRLDPRCFDNLQEVRLPRPPVVVSPHILRSRPRGATPHSAESLDRLKSDIAKLEFRDGFDVHRVAKKHGEKKQREIEGSLQRAKKRRQQTFSTEARVGFSELCVISAAQRFQLQARDIAPQEHSWRVYHPVACMPGTLRDELRFEGATLTIIDITSSQPYFLGLLLLTKMKEDGLDLGEAHDYLELARGGGFYEWFMEQLNVAVESRKEFKAIIFRDLFFGKIRFRPAPQAGVNCLAGHRSMADAHGMPSGGPPIRSVPGSWLFT